VSAGIPNPPVNYGVVIYPEITELDMFGPLQFLNFVSSKHVMNLALIASSMAPVSTRTTNKTIQTVRRRTLGAWILPDLSLG
jgi:hypothetical protein